MAKRLLLTGAPGWFANAFLADIADGKGENYSGVRCFVLDAAMAKALPDWVEPVVGDLRDKDTLSRAVAGVDEVLHAAGVVHVRRTRDWYEVNTEGTLALADCAIAAGCRRFVFLSSNAAGGSAPSAEVVLDERMPSRPRCHYGRSKLLAEQGLMARADRIDPVALRPCMFYGPPVPARHVDVYRRILDGRMPLVGDGNFRRSVVHIDNLIQAVRLALSHPAASGQTYYVADSRDYTTREVVESMAAALGVQANFLKLPRVVAPIAHLGDTLLASLGIYWQNLHLVGEADWHVGVSIAKAQRELGYAPSVDLAEGMRGAIEWCRAQGLIR